MELLLRFLPEILNNPMFETGAKFKRTVGPKKIKGGNKRHMSKAKRVAKRKLQKKSRKHNRAC